jgi:hypothetical protein
MARKSRDPEHTGKEPTPPWKPDEPCPCGRGRLSDLADDRLTWHTRKADSGGLSLSKGGASVQSGDSRSDTHVKEPLMHPYELGLMGQGQSVIFTQRGEVRRVYFPDATIMPGVREMMAEAKKFCG